MQRLLAGTDALQGALPASAQLPIREGLGWQRQSAREARVVGEMYLLGAKTSGVTKDVNKSFPLPVSWPFGKREGEEWREVERRQESLLFALGCHRHLVLPLFLSLLPR
jgi:hypothetical protein